MNASKILLAGAALLGLTNFAHAWEEGAMVSVCGACAPGQSASALALEMTVTQAQAHNPQTQHTVIVNHPMDTWQPPVRVRY
jgi:hypothetical protein